MTMLTIPPVVIEVAIMREIGLVFSVEPVMIMLVINLVTVMSVPGGISVVAVSRICLFVDTNGYVHLGAG